MSYYGDLQDRHERNLDTMAKYSRPELEAWLARPKAEWPADMQDVHDFEIESYLGKRRDNRPLTAWERFSIEEGF